MIIRGNDRGRRTSRIIKAVSFEKEMPGDTVTRLWRLHRGIITVAMARFDGERKRKRERGVEGGAGESHVMPRIRVRTIMSGDTARGRRARGGRKRERERERKRDGSVSGFSSAGWDVHSLDGSSRRSTPPCTRTRASA